MTFVLMALSIYAAAYLVFHALNRRVKNQLWAELGSVGAVWVILVLWAVSG